MSAQPSARLALVTGATGYVGGQVAARLVTDGWRVRVLTRSAERAEALPWWDASCCEAVEGDASNGEDVARAMADVDVAWYLLHSMGSDTGDFVEDERRMAETFGAAAANAGVSRIVYLGGLHPDEDDLSEHLASRVAVGEALMASGVPTAALQAGVVIGDGSSSFIMLRHLADRLPAAVAPSWIENRIQPIAVEDAVHYLVRSADLPADINRTFDIGGPDVLPYGDMLRECAVVLGHPRPPVYSAPVTTPGLAARWIGLVTPVGSGLAAPLIGSLQHDTVVSERDLDDLVGPPPGGPTSFPDAVRAALAGSDLKRWRRTVLGVGAAVAATAAVGSAMTDPTSRWYRRLRKPSFQPPAWAFPAVWTALYVDIAAISALNVADLGEDDDPAGQREYIGALAANLLLNAGWSALFFTAKRPRLALADAVFLAASSADLVRRSTKIAPERGVVLAPYAAWTAFAAALNAAIVRSNPDR